MFWQSFLCLSHNMSYACFDKKDESDCLDVTDTVCLSQSVSIAEH